MIRFAISAPAMQRKNRIIHAQENVSAADEGELNKQGGLALAGQTLLS